MPKKLHITKKRTCMFREHGYSLTAKAFIRGTVTRFPPLATSFAWLDH